MVKVFIDQMGRRLEIAFPPKRIISLVPSQTELLHELLLDEEVIGITKYCVHPTEWQTKKNIVGGTKKLDIKLIQRLKPDLIIGNKEENDQEQIEELINSFPVWMSDIKNLKAALNMIVCLGELTNRNRAANQIKLQIEHSFNNLKVTNKPLSCAYFIWRKPFMVAGSDTFINDLLFRIGFRNVFANSLFGRYPIVGMDRIKASKPSVILLSSEPFPFIEKHIPEFKTICPNSKVLIVDGEMFSWYGSRLLKSVDYFNHLISDIELLNS